KPVTDLGDSLRVMVMAAGQSTDLPLEPQFEVGEWGTPGDYRAFFIPTSPGRYTFHFHGTVKGQKVSQAFTSSPSTFSDVEDPAKVMFPVKEPSSGELAQRLDREVPRLSVAVQSAQAASRTAEQRARDAAGQARLLALAGAVTGLLGLAVAVVAFRRKPTVRVVTERRREPASAGRA
ncbi:MAG TPA: hypothetical protein VEP73_00315, partial [Actinomycetota bacterium]|nr:hypothetical protein [Actinomycetota bacterium]